MSKIRKLALSLSFAFLLLVATFIVGELALRLVGYTGGAYRPGSYVYPTTGLAGPSHYTFDAISGYSLIPNIEDKARQISTDEHGFRSTGSPYNSSQESVIFVGDSTVFGWGVADDDTFVSILSRRNARSGLNFINMGVPSYSLGNIVAVLQKKVPQYRPRVVFVQILWPWKPFESYNSPSAWREIDFDFYRSSIGIKRDFNDKKSLPKLLKSRLVMFLKDMYLKAKYAKQIRQNMIRPGVRDFSVSAETERWLAEEHVRALQDAIKALPGTPTVIFYVHPYQYTVFDPQYRNLGALGKEILISELGARDPTDYIRSRFRQEPLFIDGSHLTPAGHEVFADYLGNILNPLIGRDLELLN